MSAPEHSEQNEDDVSPTTRLVDLITENWSIKVIAVIVALALYVILHSGGDSQRTVEVDVVRVREADSTSVLLTLIPQRVHVTVKGPRALLDDLPNSIDPINLDLSQHPTVIRFEGMELKLPPGVQKIHVVPPTLPLRWDKKVSKLVKVEPSWSAPPEGLALKRLTLEPGTVMITGPKSHVDIVQKLRTTTLDLKDRAIGSHTQKVGIELTDGALSDVSVDVDGVEARFELVPETKTRTFSAIPVVALRGKGLTLRPHSVSVIVTCPPRRADELTPDLIVPKIDLEALGEDFGKKGPEDADVKANVPGCSEVSVTPARVTVSR